MFYLTWRGIRGRRKESWLLIIVLTLSFLFSSMIAVLLPSTQAALQAQREISYGSWQVMLRPGMHATAQENAIFGAETVYLPEMELARDSAVQTARNQGAQVLSLPDLASTPQGEIVSCITEDALATTHFTLLEGRLPKGEDELLVVDNQFMPGKSLHAGDTVRVKLVRRVSCTDTSAQENRGYILRTKEEAIPQYLPYVAEKWEKKDPELVRLMEDMGLDASMYDAFDAISQEERLSLADRYLSLYDDAFLMSESTHIEKLLLPHLAFDIAVEQETVSQYLRGDGYGTLKETQLPVDRLYKSLTLHRDYTISGVVAAYEAAWDIGDADMPDAFLSPAGEAALGSALQGVTASLPDLALERETGDILLFSQVEEAETLYNAMAAAYAQAMPGAYQYIYGEYGMLQYVEGLDEKTGAPRSMSTGEVLSFFPQGVDLLDPYLRIPGLLPYPEEALEAMAIVSMPDAVWRINTLSFPPEGLQSAGGVTSLVLEGALVIMTACAILVICLVQSRRRVQSLLLLFSVGMEKGQAVKMQLAEAGLFVSAALGAGLPLGLFTAKLVMYGKGYTGAMVLHGGFLGISLVMGLLSAAAGLLLPALMASRRPLTGKRNAVTPPRGKPRRLSPHAPLPLWGMEWTAHRFSRRRDRVSRFLCGAMVFMALATLSISHLSMEDYRSRVVRTDQPDFVMTATYGMNSRYLREKINALAASDDTLQVDAYVCARHVTLQSNDAVAKSALWQHFAGSTGALAVDALGLPRDGDIFARLTQLCPEVDLDKLAKAEGCILVLPRYKMEPDGSYTLGFDAAKPGFVRDTGLQVGDVLQLEAESHTVGGASESTGTRRTRVELPILGIVYDFMDVGIWPFAGEKQPFIIVSGEPLVSKLYPAAAKRLSAEQARWNRNLQVIHCPYCNGGTVFQVSSSRGVEAAQQCWSYARQEEMEMINYSGEKLELFRACQNQQVIACLVGIMAVLLVGIILVFILTDLAAQNRSRTGILRAIGASSGQLALSQWLISAVDALLSLLGANLAVAAVWVAAVWASAGFVWMDLQGLWSALAQGLLRGYPWLLHGGICLAAWVLLAVMRTLPFTAFSRGSIIASIKGIEE